MDAGAYNAYECFVSMQVCFPAQLLSLISQLVLLNCKVIARLTVAKQTGNTIFAALGVSNLPVSSPRLAWTKSLTSVLSFLLGALCLSTLHRRFGTRKRGVLAANFAVQAVFTFAAVLLVESRLTSGSPAADPEVLQVMKSSVAFPMMDLVPIALLSFQASGMIVASRMLTYNGMPTIVLTSAYNDIMSDPGLFTSGITGDVQRNRRVGGVALYFLGAVGGGALATSPLGFAGSLWIAGAVKAGIVAAWLAWRGETEEEREERES